jgi:glycosyltransferase involved in cell wall biosynthesis
MLGEQEGGNESYVTGLIQGLTADVIPPDVTINVLYPPARMPPRQPAAHIQPVSIGSVGNVRRTFFRIPALCRQIKADILHVTYNASPFSQTPLVLSVHDVIFRHYPEHFSPRVRLLMSVMLPLSMRRAAAIITLSESSKRDIIRFYPFTADKVSAIPLGPGPVVDVAADYAAAAQYSENRSFFLAVGTIQPRKNLSRLIHAYTLARDTGGFDTRLIVVGKAAWQHSDVYQYAKQSPYCSDIIFTGYLSDAVLAALYAQCTAFIYPSIYEGFGLPVLEAMACGAPVITSDTSSLPEVAGDAALFVDPYSIAAISAALTTIHTNDDLRQRLRVRGLERAKKFSWKHTAEQTLAVYQTVSQRSDHAVAVR